MLTLALYYIHDGAMATGFATAQSINCINTYRNTPISSAKLYYGSLVFKKLPPCGVQTKRSRLHYYHLGASPRQILATKQAAMTI